MEKQTIGQYIKRMRLIRGFESQRQLAYKADIHNSTLAQIERDEARPTPETLRKLAEVLRLNYFDLLVRAGYIPADYATSRMEPDEPLSEDEIAVIRKLIKKYVRNSD